MNNMENSEVAFLKVKRGKDAVQQTVKRIMRLKGWEKYVTGNKIFLKINAMNHTLVPGTNTSPWVVEGVLTEILEKKPNAEIIFGDADLASCKNVDIAAETWGYNEISDKYGVEFVNLSKDKLKEVKVDGGFINKIELPRTLLDCDNLVSLPVLKTHNWSTVTASLKNQWGCIPRSRHIFHLFLHEIIPDINYIIKPSFAVLDGTICLEGTGPRTGKPKVCNMIMASNDLVALDSASASYMGFDPYNIRYIGIAHEKRIGNMNFRIIGDEFETNPFVPCGETIVTFMHKKLRSSFLEPLLFRTKFFDFLAWLATMYNVHYWYKFNGKKETKELIENSWYGEQFDIAKL